MAESQEVDKENDTVECVTDTVKIEEQREEPIERRYPDREGRKPDCYGDYICGFEDDMTNLHYCYRLKRNVPQTFTSVSAEKLANAMDEEIE